MPKQTPFRIPKEKIVDQDGQLTFGWQIHMELIANQLKAPANQDPPANSAVPGTNGQIALDDNFLYIFSQASNQWKRIPLTNF